MRRSGSIVTDLIRSRPLRQTAHESDAVRELASQWLAGELITDAVFQAAKLRRQGLSLSFHHLPELGSTNSAAQLSSLLESLGPDATGVELSVKPSTIGATQSRSTAERHLRELAETADEYGALVTLEMEEYQEYQPNLDMFRSVRKEHPDLGFTVPVNVRRAESDCHDLAREAARVRVCVGAYPTPKAAAVKGEHNKSRALVRCLRILMESEAYPMVASHDPRIIAIAQDLAQVNGRAGGDFEFQMLLGVRPLEQRRLVDIGLTARTYLPFGPGWYEYLAMRIAARPRTLLSYGRAILDKR